MARSVLSTDQGEVWVEGVECRELILNRQEENTGTDGFGTTYYQVAFGSAVARKIGSNMDDLKSYQHTYNI